MSLKRTSYTDFDGRNSIVLLPEDVSDEEAANGVLVGPPDLSELDLPLETEIRLHNELFNRGIIERSDALKKRQEIMWAITSAFKVDVDRIVSIYLGEGYKNANQEPPENKPNSPVPSRRPRESAKSTSLSVSG